MSESFTSLLGRLSAGDNLSFDEMQSAVNAVMTGGCPEGEIALFLTALSAKGETVDEVAGAAAALRHHMTPIRSQRDPLLDTCGTGGSGSALFNVSTTAALVIAAAGVPVAKHGNRSVTSKSGSADVLGALGVNIQASVPQVERCLEDLGICFCFAPLMHPAMKHVSAVRKQLGIRTIFNLLGPLANPAGAKYQVLGVGRPELRSLIAESLQRLGTVRSFVLSGRDGLGEVTLAEATDVKQVGATEQEFTWSPEDFGLDRASLDAVSVDGPEQSAMLVRGVLARKRGPARDIVLMNAAAGLLAVGRVVSPREGAELAAETIDRGTAAELLERLIEVSHKPV